MPPGLWLWRHRCGEDTGRCGTATTRHRRAGPRRDASECRQGELLPGPPHRTWRASLAGAARCRLPAGSRVQLTGNKDRETREQRLAATALLSHSVPAARPLHAVGGAHEIRPIGCENCLSPWPVVLPRLHSRKGGDGSCQRCCKSRRKKCTHTGALNRACFP